MLIGTGMYLSGWNSEHGVDPCRKGEKIRKGGKGVRREKKKEQQQVMYGDCIQRQKDHCKFESSLGYDTKSPFSLSQKIK